MKNLLACFAVFAVVSAGAQSTMSYNPDANNDGYITSPDLLSFLPLFGSQVGIDSSLTCDYDGSTLEGWLGDLWSGIIVLDSVLVQFNVEDSALVFIPGCPDPVMDYVSYSRAYTLTTLTQYSANNIRFQQPFLGYTRAMEFRWYADVGTYRIIIIDLEVSQSGIGDVLGAQSAYALSPTGSIDMTIPIPGQMTESGISFINWSGFLSNATYVNILPYWHYAE